VDLKYHISEWAAWAPGLDSYPKWQLYFNKELALDLSQKPDVTFLPAMFRRKLSPLCRMVFATVNSLKKQDALKNSPLVFSSRHGELDLSIKLINSMIESEPMSPAGFSMSVHNSPAGLLSIFYKNKNASTAISARGTTLSAAFLEAVTQLQINEQVVLCYADLSMPEPFKQFENNEVYPRCLTMVLNTGASEKKSLEISTADDFESIVKQLSSKF
jgi:hypothetical protein